MLQPLFGLSRDFEEEFRLCFAVAGPLGRAGGAAPGPEGRNVDHICRGIRPCNEASLRAHLERHGVAIIAAGSRYGAEGEGQAIYVRDPDGNAIELKGAE